MNAVAHIYDGGEPTRHDGPAHRNALVGFALHAGACVWWAAFFEGIFGRAARRSTVAAAAGGAAVAAGAYVVDYKVVGRRFQPGFEQFLSGRSMLAVYASIAAAFTLSAALRRLHHHQVENGNEGDKRRHAERGPDAVVAPEQAGQRRT
jgi:hypothetical protein